MPTGTANCFSPHHSNIPVFHYSVFFLPLLPTHDAHDSQGDARKAFACDDA